MEEIQMTYDEDESDEEWDARIEKMTLPELKLELAKINKRIAMVDAEIRALSGEGWKFV